MPLCTRNWNPGIHVVHVFDFSSPSLPPFLYVSPVPSLLSHSLPLSFLVFSLPPTLALSSPPCPSLSLPSLCLPPSIPLTFKTLWLSSRSCLLHSAIFATIVVWLCCSWAISSVSICTMSIQNTRHYVIPTQLPRLYVPSPWVKLSNREQGNEVSKLHIVYIVKCTPISRLSNKTGNVCE